MTSAELKQIRQHLSLTQEQFAEALDVSRNTIARYETSQEVPARVAQRINLLLTARRIRP